MNHTIQFILGLDGGGTKTVARLVDLQTSMQWQVNAGATSLSNDYSLALASITDACGQLFEQAGCCAEQVSAVFGVAGAGDKSLVARLERDLVFKFAKLNVVSDAKTSLYGANAGHPVAVVALGTGSVGMGSVCLIGLALWAVRHPFMAIAYGPLAAFALLNFLIGNRAVFYSAPIFWFGAAFLMTSAARFVTEAISSQLNAVTHTRPVSSPVSIAVASLSLVIAWVNTPTGYVPRPSFPKPVLEGLVKLENIATSEASVVATWWDYGYASLFLNKLPTNMFMIALVA